MNILQVGYHDINVKTAIDYIKSNYFLLPAIQRNYVWDSTRIADLYDSLYKNYPIGLILLLKLSGKEDKNLMSFYEFNKSKKNNNSLFGTSEYSLDIDDEKYCVLDGQQRLTALYRGLYYEDYYRKRTYNLYFNATADENYENSFFEFKCWEKLLEKDKLELWIKVSEIYEISYGDTTAIEALIDKSLSAINYDWLYTQKRNGTKKEKTAQWAQKQIATYKELADLIQKNKENLIKNINKLINVLRNKNCIGYQLIDYTNLSVEEKSMRILSIFTRLNQGGVKLSPSSLLYSQIAAYSKNYNIDNIRGLFDEYIKELNAPSPNICFSLENYMRLLWLIFGGSSFKAFFVSKDIKKCSEDDLRKAKDCLIQARQVFIEANFSFYGNLPYNMFLPIAYYFYHCGKLSSTDKLTACYEIAKYYEAVLSSGYFSVHSDSVLYNLKTAFEKNQDKLGLFQNKVFDFRILQSQVNSTTTSKGKKLEINNETVEKILNLDYREDKSEILKILYLLNKDWMKIKRTVDDIDHIHPKKYSDPQTFKSANVPESLYHVFVEKHNLLPNLQLLSAQENRTEKQGLPLKIWMKKYNQNYTSYAAANIIVDNKEIAKLNWDYFDFENFEIFFNNRRDALKNYMYEIFGITP